MKEAKIQTAAQLSIEEQEAIKTRIDTLVGEPCTYSFEVQPALIGGFRAYVDGQIYDLSMLAKLKDVGSTLMREAADTSASAQEAIDEIGTYLKEKLTDLPNAYVYKYGTVQSCADGIARVDGLANIRSGELLEFENNAFGMAMELAENSIGAVLFSGADAVYAGSIVRGTGRVLSIGVGEAMLGRVVDPLGRPLDNAPLEVKEYGQIEYPAPGIMDRAPVNAPMETGILSIDSMIPIGKGQRELIIGDRQMGKTTIALSAMLHQSKKGMVCIYCAIGQKASTIAQVVNTLHTQGNKDNCIVVASTASDSSAMQYITPYAGCAIAEYFMYQGKDVLIVYDDLSKHATSYRTISLLLKRPPGREAYPGDVFYLHSRLLERAAKLSEEKGGGSMTALPIVETMAGDISAYIPTNVISITDGQIYLESELFHAGVRPAVNVGLSVSRVGRAAQTPAMRKMSGTLRLRLAQYREMAVFAQFGADIDASTKHLLDDGERLTELLKQDQNTIYTLAEQVAILYAFEQGVFSELPTSAVHDAKIRLCAFLHEADNALLQVIDRSMELSEENLSALQQLFAQFRSLQNNQA